MALHRNYVTNYRSSTRGTRVIAGQAGCRDRCTRWLTDGSLARKIHKLGHHESLRPTACKRTIQARYRWPAGYRYRYSHRKDVHFHLTGPTLSSLYHPSWLCSVTCFLFCFFGRSFFRVSNIKTEMLTEQDRHLACVCDNKTSYRVYSLFLLRWISFVLTTQTTILLYPVLIPTPPTPPNVVSGLHSHRGKGRKCNWKI